MHLHRWRTVLTVTCADITETELVELKFAAELLGEVCGYSPKRMTIEELVTALPARGSRMVADDVDIAERFLQAHGLARRDGDYLVPTLAGDTAYLLWTVAPLSPSLD